MPGLAWSTGCVQVCALGRGQRGGAEHAEAEAEARRLQIEVGAWHTAACAEICTEVSARRAWSHTWTGSSAKQRGLGWLDGSAVILCGSFGWLGFFGDCDPLTWWPA